MSEPLPDAPTFITRYRWRMRLGSALVLMLLVSTVGVVWYFFVRAPSPTSLCEHVDALRRTHPADSPGFSEAMTPLAADSSALGSTHSDTQLCTWYFTTQHKERGFFEYGALARCVGAAQSPSALHSCL